MRQPSFIVFTGPMCGGKTSALLSYVDRCKYQKKNVIAFKPAIDTRYDKTSITSHSGWKVDAIVVKSISELVNHIVDIGKPDVLALDEAFMLNGSADALIWLYKQGVSIVVATLDLGYNGKSFKETEKMLSWATKIVKCPSVCVVCGMDAYYTHKKVVSEQEIEVGGLELYEPRCWEHHPHIKNVD